MQVAPLLARYFHTTIRERGYQYFRQKRVRIGFGSASEVSAEVRGSEDYLLLMQWTGERLEVFCGCIYFIDKGQPCKHLWAAILAADAEQHLSAVATAKFPALDTGALLDQAAEKEIAPLAGIEPSRRKPKSTFVRPPQPAA